MSALIVAFSLLIAACGVLPGPATREYSCPQLCEETQRCCGVNEICSRYPDAPCKPGPGPWGASRDAGRE